jgi:hypothetical protein
MPTLERAKSVVTKKLMDLREAETLAAESAPSPCPDALEQVTTRPIKRY